MQQKSHESLNDLPNEDMGSCSEKNRAWHSMGIKFSQIAKKEFQRRNPLSRMRVPFLIM
jgi:hypothetical protein